MIGNAADLPTFRAAVWLRLAAAPSFAIMAVLTLLPGGEASMVCSTGSSVFPLNGMAPMYMLMSTFHSAPWLKLLARIPASRGRNTCRKGTEITRRIKLEDRGS